MSDALDFDPQERASERPLSPQMLQVRCSRRQSSRLSLGSCVHGGTPVVQPVAVGRVSSPLSATVPCCEQRVPRLQVH